MSMLRNITRGLRSLFRTEQVDQELDEERGGSRKFAPPLIPRNLLILQDGRNYKNIGFAQVRYTAGTRRLAKGPLVIIDRDVISPKRVFLGSP